MDFKCEMKYGQIVRLQKHMKILKSVLPYSRRNTLINKNHFGWLMAKTSGFMHEAVFARKAGSCELRGVMRSNRPNRAKRQTTTNGVQAISQMETLVMATLVTRSSALMPLPSSWNEKCNSECVWPT